MTEPVWVFAPYAFKDRIGGNIHEVASDIGLDIDICDFDEKFKKYESPKDYGIRPVILYGSHQFVRRHYHRYYPGAFGLQGTSINEYMSNIPSQWLLNSDGMALPWGLYKSQFERLCDLYNSDSLFIKPIDGSKSFTGFTTTKENFVIDCLTVEQLSAIENHQFIWISKPKNIQSEYRYVVINKQIVAGSDYNWDDFNDIKGITDEECDQLAQKVAQYTWQPDFMYTVDVGLSDNQPKIIEFNSFSCAGFYGCNLKNILISANDAIKIWWKHEGF